ncbi:MAG TPA: hypothetical protein PL101_04150 [Bacteroidales bacterium]|jgi:hypothetical protein|nr:hypothetical protein [Bacteroidales bacterium]
MKYHYLFIIIFSFSPLFMSAGQKMQSEDLKLVSCCCPENDVYRAICESGINCSRFNTPAEAIRKVNKGGAVLLLADTYPEQRQIIAPELYDLAEKKNIRLFIEYPDHIPGIETGETKHADLERGVITSEIFGNKLPPMRIVAISDCYFVPAFTPAPAISLAKVAGFDKAVYGLPQTSWPLLFFHPEKSILIGTTKLSQFITGRYAPGEAWKEIWMTILRWLLPKEEINEITWMPILGPAYSINDQMPADIEKMVIKRGLDWITNSHLLIHPSWKDKDWKIDKIITPTSREINQNASQRFLLPTGDGSEGIIEGYKSRIYHDGTQPVQWVLRSDCSGEQAASFILGGTLLNKSEWIKIGENLINFALYKFDEEAPWNNPSHPAFGLIGFYRSPELKNPWENRETSFFGAINSRICLSALVSAGILNTNQWDDRVLKVILANYRTTGRYGLREDAISSADLRKNGWQYYYNSENSTIAPFPAAQLFALNLIAYHTTGFKPLLEKTRTAIGIMMEAYPGRWRFYNGMQQDRARMLLPLAWLVRVDDTPEHRQWLNFMANEFISYQDDCGAIYEQLGMGPVTFTSQKSNETYGISETSLIQENGDPVSDLLYTLNSGFTSLHEVVAVTGDPKFKEAEDKLAEFLCRIQTRSKQIPELDGTWLRSFDFKRWEYWGSNGDSGWGAWCAETGWIQGSILTTFSLRQMNTSLWDIMAKRSLEKLLEKNLYEMLGEK